MDKIVRQTKTSPIVSVLVTVYNRESYLTETLESILNSSWADFELIVVDDASSDNSLSVAESFAKSDDRLRVVANEKNLGDYANRVKAASIARGKYIKYVDSDDLIYPHSLALMVNSLERYPDAALALSHSKPEDESPYPWRLTPNEVYKKHYLDLGCLGCGPSGAIIRLDAFKAIGGFDEKWKVLSDTELWLRLASRWPAILLPPGLVWWRRHEEQEFTKNDAETVYLESGYQLDTNVLTNPECPLTHSERSFALEKIRQHFARRLLSLAIRKNRFSSALAIYKRSNLAIVDLVKGLRSYR